MSLSIHGTVVEVGQVEQVTQKFAKQSVVIEIQDGQYTNNLALEFKDSAPNDVAKGVSGTFHLNLRSNQSQTGRWFTNAMCWKFEADGGQQTRPTRKPLPQAPDPADDVDDGLPF